MVAIRLSCAALAVLSLLGCANFGYYTQAIGGQLDVYSRTRPIADLVADPQTDPALREKLIAVLEIRDFASRELGLPENGSYRTYADLERPYALWNVFATKELSLKPTEWCFPITGCVNYRGYFSEREAEAFAAKLRAAGDDVYVGGVSAYSTLGWFDDPVLNTIVNRPLPEIAGLLFHELAHQHLYVKGDTAFSESFAMTVELEGMRRWLAHHGASDDYERYEIKLKQRDKFTALVLKHRDRLDALYQSDMSSTEKRAGKARIFGELRAEYERLRAEWGGYDGWFARDLNNAHLVSLGTYFQHVPAFQALLARHRGDLLAFYRAVNELGQLPTIERVAALSTFLPTATLEPQ